MKFIRLLPKKYIVFDLKADSIRQGFKYLKEKSAAMKEAAKEMKKNAEEIRVMMKDYIPKVVYVVGDKVVSESDIRKVMTRVAL